MATLFTFLTVRAMFVMITLSTLSMVVLTTISGNYLPPEDPFVSFADILPGHSREAVIGRGFTCQNNGPPLYQESCLLTPETGAFSQVEITIDNGTGAVNRVAFTPKDKVLPLGQLILLWGGPKTKDYAGITNLRWGSYHTIAIPQAYLPHMSYWLPITYVAFESHTLNSNLASEASLQNRT